MASASLASESPVSPPAAEGDLPSSAAGSVEIEPIGGQSSAASTCIPAENRSGSKREGVAKKRRSNGSTEITSYKLGLLPRRPLAPLLELNEDQTQSESSLAGNTSICESRIAGSTRLTVKLEDIADLEAADCDLMDDTAARRDQEKEEDPVQRERQTLFDNIITGGGAKERGDMEKDMAELSSACLQAKMRDLESGRVPEVPMSMFNFCAESNACGDSNASSPTPGDELLAWEQGQGGQHGAEGQEGHQGVQPLNYGSGSTTCYTNGRVAESFRSKSGPLIQSLERTQNLESVLEVLRGPLQGGAAAHPNSGNFLPAPATLSVAGNAGSTPGGAATRGGREFEFDSASGVSVFLDQSCASRTPAAGPERRSSGRQALHGSVGSWCGGRDRHAHSDNLIEVDGEDEDHVEEEHDERRKNGANPPRIIAHEMLVGGGNAGGCPTTTTQQLRGGGPPPAGGAVEDDEDEYNVKRDDAPSEAFSAGADSVNSGRSSLINRAGTMDGNSSIFDGPPGAGAVAFLDEEVENCAGFGVSGGHSYSSFSASQCAAMSPSRRTSNEGNSRRREGGCAASSTHQTTARRIHIFSPGSKDCGEEGGGEVVVEKIINESSSSTSPRLARGAVPAVLEAVAAGASASARTAGTASHRLSCCGETEADADALEPLRRVDVIGAAGLPVQLLDVDGSSDVLAGVNLRHDLHDHHDDESALSSLLPGRLLSGRDNSSSSSVSGNSDQMTERSLLSSSQANAVGLQLLAGGPQHLHVTGGEAEDDDSIFENMQMQSTRQLRPPPRDHLQLVSGAGAARKRENTTSRGTPPEQVAGATTTALTPAVAPLQGDSGNVFSSSCSSSNENDAGAARRSTTPDLMKDLSGEYLETSNDERQLGSEALAPTLLEQEVLQDEIECSHRHPVVPLSNPAMGPRAAAFVEATSAAGKNKKMLLSKSENQQLVATSMMTKQKFAPTSALALAQTHDAALTGRINTKLQFFGDFFLTAEQQRAYVSRKQRLEKEQERLRQKHKELEARENELTQRERNLERREKEFGAKQTSSSSSATATSLKSTASWRVDHYLAETGASPTQIQLPEIPEGLRSIVKQLCFHPDTL